MPFNPVVGAISQFIGGYLDTSAKIQMNKLQQQEEGKRQLYGKMLEEESASGRTINDPKLTKLIDASYGKGATEAANTRAKGVALQNAADMSQMVSMMGGAPGGTNVAPAPTTPTTPTPVNAAPNNTINANLGPASTTPFNTPPGGNVRDLPRYSINAPTPSTPTPPTQTTTGPSDTTTTSTGPTPTPTSIPPSGTPQRVTAKPKMEMIKKPGEKMQFNVTTPGVDEQKYADERNAQIEQSKYASAWLEKNPQIARAYGPQFVDAVKNANPIALSRAQELMKDPAVQPLPQDILALGRIKDLNDRSDAALLLYGTAEKASAYLASDLGQTGAVDTKNLSDKVKSEAAIQAALQGKNPRDPEIARQAAKTVLQNEHNVRVEESSMTLNRMITVANLVTSRGEQQQQRGLVAGVAKQFLEKSAVEAPMLNRFDTGLKTLEGYAAQIAKGIPPTNSFFKKPLTEVLRTGQFGPKDKDTKLAVGQVLALAKDYAVEVATIQRRGLFNMPARTDAKTQEAAANAVYKEGDTVEVMLDKLKRSRDLLNDAAKTQADQKAGYVKALNMMGMKDAANAFQSGLYDYTKTLLNSHMGEPNPADITTFSAGADNGKPVGK